LEREAEERKKEVEFWIEERNQMRQQLEQYEQN